MSKSRLPRELLNGLFMLLGILSAGMGLNGFLLSSNFIDGGVTGVSMLLAKITGLSTSSSTASRNTRPSRSCRAAAARFARRSCPSWPAGVTVYLGKGGMSGEDQEILFCVVTRLEIGKVKAMVREIDESAFVVLQALADVEGGVVKRAPLH